MKIHPVGAELCHAEGRADIQRDMTRLIVVFRSFWNAPKNRRVCYFFRSCTCVGREIKKGRGCRLCRCENQKKLS